MAKAKDVVVAVDVVVDGGFDVNLYLNIVTTVDGDSCQRW